MKICPFFSSFSAQIAPLHPVPNLSSPMASLSSRFLLSPKLPKLAPKPLSLRSSSSSTPSSFDLQNYWSTLLAEINAHLDSAIPVRYPETIYRSMRHAVLSPGAKRAAPVMCVASCELLGYPRSSSLPAAAALEMVHAASLVHDDLPSFDSSPSRRGLPSTHSLFGVGIAVLAGDALLPLALHHLASSPLVPPSTLLRVVREITRAVGATGMAAGQLLDLEEEELKCEDGVIRILEKKFGEMAECSAVCGGLIGGATDEEVERLRRYGRAVGVLYRVADDVLMMEGEGRDGGGMRSRASVVGAMGIDRATEVVEELRGQAKRELEEFGDKYGERVLPLYSFVDYAVERGFAVEAGEVAAA